MAVTEAYDASPLSEKFRNINLIPFHESDLAVNLARITFSFRTD
jgi:hypothetical protein